MQAKQLNALKNRIVKASRSAGAMGSMILIYTKQAMTQDELKAINTYLEKYPEAQTYWNGL